MNEEYAFTVEVGGARLDKFVAERLPELSRTHARKLIDEGYITVNGEAAKPSLKLAEGDDIEVVVPPENPPDLVANDIPLNIIYEDRDVLVVDKPAGLAVHPAPGHPDHTLVNAVLHHLPDLAAEDAASLRPGIVHRLDMDTSGIIVVAKNRAAQADLSAQFAERTVAKTYLVLVRGRLTPEKGIIDAAIGRDRANRQRMAVSAKGREARTDYRVVRYAGDYTLAEIKPETGRTHQIRVHLAAIGYPVVGDATYGVKAPFLERQFLHAHRIRFRLPSTGEEAEFESPLPEDLERALEAIKG